LSLISFRQAFAPFCRSLDGSKHEKEYFDDIQDVQVTRDMLDLAKHIVTQKTADFEPERFEDHYEEALTELINAKRNGKTVGPKPRPRGENVVDLMDAPRRSIGGSEPASPRSSQKSRARRRPGRKKC
jgi:DNA end-binding protein Ku